MRKGLRLQSVKKSGDGALSLLVKYETAQFEAKTFGINSHSWNIKQRQRGSKLVCDQVEKALRKLGLQNLMPEFSISQTALIPFFVCMFHTNSKGYQR